MTTEFLLTDTERREPYEPRTCRVVRRLRNEIVDDLALVEIEPPLPRHIYDTDRDLDHLVLASRHQGRTIFPVSEWPLCVYICSLKDGRLPQGEKIDSNNLELLAWGELMPMKKNRNRL